MLYFAMPYLSGASLGQVIKTARSHESPGAGLSSFSFEELVKEAHSRSQSASEAPIVAGPTEPRVVTPGNARPAAPESPAGPSPTIPAQGPSASPDEGVRPHRGADDDCCGRRSAPRARGGSHSPGLEADEYHGRAGRTRLGARLRLGRPQDNHGRRSGSPLAFPIAVPAPEADASLTYGPLAWMPMEGEPANKTCRLTSK